LVGSLHQPTCPQLSLDLLEPCLGGLVHLPHVCYGLQVSQQAGRSDLLITSLHACRPGAMQVTADEHVHEVVVSRLVIDHTAATRYISSTGSQNRVNLQSHMSGPHTLQTCCGQQTNKLKCRRVLTA
jgi:hypothetical protein